jgi:hypothetical protein
MKPKHPRGLEIEAYALSPLTGATDAQVLPFSSGGQFAPPSQPPIRLMLVRRRRPPM